MNAITIPYITNWVNSRQQSNLSEMMSYVSGVIQSDPPMETGINAAIMGGNPFP